jgi:hypothetical protein
MAPKFLFLLWLLGMKDPCSSNAFVVLPPISTTKTNFHTPDPAYGNRRLPRPPLYMQSSDDCNPDIPDSARRRQLLYSLLAAAGGSSSLLSNPAAAAAAEDTSIATVAAAAPESAATTIDWSTISVMKPPSDDRDYRLTLLDNGLRVILCSDPSSNEAGAAMDVHVGACSDPKDIPGLAHFTERELES